jgi:hypothetical protein
MVATLFFLHHVDATPARCGGPHTLLLDIRLDAIRHLVSTYHDYRYRPRD